MSQFPFNITIYRGLTLQTHRVKFSDSDGANISLSGWSAWWEARDKDGVLKVSLGPTVTQDDDDEWCVEIGMTDEQTAALADSTLGTWEHDLIVENTSGEKLGPYVAGKLKVLDPVSATT